MLEAWREPLRAQHGTDIIADLFQFELKVTFKNLELQDEVTEKKERVMKLRC